MLNDHPYNSSEQHHRDQSPSTSEHPEMPKDSFSSFSFLMDDRSFRENREEISEEKQVSTLKATSTPDSPVSVPALEITKHILDVDGHSVSVYERRPANISHERAVVYLPGFLEGLSSNEEFLNQIDDRVVFALEVSAGTNRFEALRAVVNTFLENEPRPDVVTHSMGAFVLDHDFSQQPEDIEIFHRAVLITPPGFIEGESISRLVSGFVKEAWQATFSPRPEFRRKDVNKPLLEGCKYIYSGVTSTINEALHVSSVDLAKVVAHLLQEGKQICSILTTNDCLVPGDKTEAGLRRGGLIDDQITVVENTHVPHINAPQDTAAIVKAWLPNDSLQMTADENLDEDVQDNE